MVLAVSASAQVADSPWPMFRHDLHHTGRTSYTGPAAPTVKWTFTADDGIAASPTIGADGTIYVGAGWNFIGATDSCLYAINPDGSMKWKFGLGAGIFSSAAVGSDGTLYFGSHDRRIYAVEDSVTYGKLKWSINLDLWVYSSPAIGADGTIYVGSPNFGFYAIDPNGTVKWSYETDWCIISSPAIGPDGAIYVGSKDHNLYAFEDSVTYGKLRWKSPTGVFYEGYLVDSSPAIGPDGTIYVGTDPYGAAGQDPVPVDSVFFAINPDGSLKWKFPMGDGAESSPAIGPDGVVYVGSYDGNLYAIRDQGDEGVLEWAFPTGGAIDGSPTVDGCGTIYVGSRDSTIYAINPDGTQRWSFLTNGDIESSPTIIDNGILYIGSFDGNLYALGNGGPDVGVVSVDFPSQVWAGSLVIPTATIRNYRSGSQGFYVSCLIDTAGYKIYGDTLYVNNLGELTSVRETFSQWSVSPDTGIVYNITVTTLLNSDDNWYNDTLTVQVQTISDVISSTKEDGEKPPSNFLGRCFPNPFNAGTTIEFSIAERAHVKLQIFNIAGQRVRTLVDGERSPGSYNGVTWDGRDNTGRPVASGVYFCRLTAADFTQTRKMILLK